MAQGDSEKKPLVSKLPRQGKKRGNKRQIPWLYDLVLWTMSVLIDLFFREVHPRGAWKIPKKGPIILVAAPHANQFVDSLILMRIVKTEANRRISYLIAEKSTKRKFIGTLSAAIGAIPVARALDKVKPAQGRIYLPDPDHDPTLVRGIGTDFTNGDFEVGGLIVLPKVRGQAPSTEIAEIISPTEIRLKKPFKTPEALEALNANGAATQAITSGEGSEKIQPENLGTTFKVAPYVDNSKVYNAVFEELEAGGCIGIFPEGGSHDRPDLLPLKAGVAIMALGAEAKYPGCGVKIIPVGMNYFHPHKFRSRAVIEFGHPIELHPDQVEAYKAGDRRNAVGSLLETVYQGLISVTQACPDYDTLMLVQAARRLYNPTGKKLPLPLVVELNRRLVQGYTKYKDDPRVVELKKDVLDYNRELRALGIRDHQVEWGNAAKRPRWYVLGTLIYRLGELLFMGIGTLPGLAMFWPVFVTTKVISVKKSREALAASTVKIKGRDVIATWKLLVAMAFAPALYIYYTVVVSLWLAYNRRGGYYTYRVPWWMVARTYVPDFVPMWLFSILFFILCICVTFAALRIGEIGMDIVKSLPPLFVALNPRSSSRIVQLRQKRERLSAKVTDVINTLGPEVFPDFDAKRIVADPFKEGAYQSSYKQMPEEPRLPDSADPATPTSGGFQDAGASSASSPFSFLPSNESFGNIGGFGFFSSRPATPSGRSRSRSRSSSGGGGLTSVLKPFSTLSDNGSLDEVSKRIRGAMRERGRKRESEGVETGTESSWDMASAGQITPTTEDEEPKKDR
ncbi:Glycerol-3-phosphate/dihydroxyacetone phosphate acyltransferase [Exophiala dermatitidis]|uniref:Glycerol-3-phosphate/dihydroxyacetone phosphate acyltransferase n=1 Tax=Exophiala dermatitidis TaxID=5970 RepID=A0AAN6F285_EXODE|nr:Glycerol-3-phosphate/dihydroxyacetone phosphate acyltransferase [Exophiala dermatitidis]KAJ4527880.1 Glycerol-3-phosphate/dihydroxyacetone phosphate acyltransferase [Exophiala dermatitidis]KAJ4528514.1 Glycerol-3-phosphate/dihydroxyacetone phosphate acyltransferase [Exophiala dermatitidis]KAJ4529884.1 Glycerol-3-phosphate/dihydroxyacetone phosphate acyltransferase [Exophiala dermatitidis]KAJ4552872.1 Glycerol-3-phosphate/dihydroxyacetone phosphate acyltransferase [Exophiala dermatitidis]